MTPPNIPDEWEGHTFAKSDARPSRDEWEYQTLLELVAARNDGKPVSFRVPEGV